MQPHPLTISQITTNHPTPSLPGFHPADLGSRSTHPGQHIHRRSDPHELSGVTVYQRTTDGYFNATAMCKAAGKMIGHWSQNADTKKVLAALSSVIGIPITGNPGLVIIKQGGTPGEQGTWVHKKVALHLANWCSPEFYAAALDWTVDE